MSLNETMDDNDLLGDEYDALDYDIEKDLEEALLADADDEDANENKCLDDELDGNEEDILDIDANIRLDETEEELSEQIQGDDVQEAIVTTHDDEEESLNETKPRIRFDNERAQNFNINRLTTNKIPDTLDKVAIKPLSNLQYQKNNNGRYQRGNRGRGRGRYNQYHVNNNNNNNNNSNNNRGGARGSVFARVGNVPVPSENKTVLINPHFRGNVQVNENARLVWDSNLQTQQQPLRCNNVPMIQISPFQNQPSPWIHAPYAEPANIFNRPQQGFQEQTAIAQYNQPHVQPTLDQLNIGLRTAVQHNNILFNQQGSGGPQLSTGNFRNRDVMNFDQSSRNNFHAQQRSPFPNQTQNNIQQMMQVPQHHQQYDQSAQFSNQLQYSTSQNQPFQQSSNQNFAPQNFNQPVVYDSYNNQNQFNSPPTFQQAPAPLVPLQNNQNFQSSPNYKHNISPQHYDPNYNGIIIIIIINNNNNNSNDQIET